MTTACLKRHGGTRPSARDDVCTHASMHACMHTLEWAGETYIVVSLGEVVSGVVPHGEGRVVSDQRIPVVSETELLVGATCKQHVT